MAHNEDLEAAQVAILKRIASSTDTPNTDAEKIKLLAEAYAWLRVPGQDH